MDRVEMPEGSRANRRKQFTFGQKSSGYPDTPLIRLGRMEG